MEANSLNRLFCLKLAVKAMGNTGHGSRFIDGTAVEQLIGVTNKALEYRKKQRDLLFGVGDGSEGHFEGCSHAIVKKKVRNSLLPPCEALSK